MKHVRTIVTGIDFSSCSLNALEYAAGLCNSLNASMVVVHAYRAPSRAGTLTSIDRHIRKNLREEILKVLEPILLRYPDLQFGEAIRRADPLDAFLWTAKKFRADLIVVGTQGIHESPSVFIGSTTGSLIKLGNAPVLAIPSNCHYTPYQRVLFAVKHPYVASREVLNPFLLFLEHFHPIVDLLHVTRDSTPDLSHFPNPYPIAPHTNALVTSDSDNIYQSVQAYLTNHTADLLVVISRLRGFFEGLFAQRSTSTTMFNSELPILVLHGGVRE